MEIDDNHPRVCSFMGASVMDLISYVFIFFFDNDEIFTINLFSSDMLIDFLNQVKQWLEIIFVKDLVVKQQMPV